MDTLRQHRKWSALPHALKINLINIPTHITHIEKKRPLEIIQAVQFPLIEVSADSFNEIRLNMAYQ